MAIIHTQNRPLMIARHVVDAVPHIGLDGLGLYVWLLQHAESIDGPTWEEWPGALGLEEETIQILLYRLQYQGLIEMESHQSACEATPQEGRHRVEICDEPLSKKEKRLNPGYVYIIEGGGHYKIGLSIRPEKRLKSLQTAVPFPLTCVHLIPTQFMVQTESVLHTTFAEKRTKGEWFALDEDDIAWISRQFLPTEGENTSDEVPMPACHADTGTEHSDRMEEHIMRIS